MKRIKNIITGLILVGLVWLLSGPAADNCHAVDLFPEVSGNGVGDSIVLLFEVFDTTAVPQLSDPDSLMILQYGPDGSLLASLAENDDNVFNPRTGSYEVHLKSGDGSSTGKYIVRVFAYKGGQIRGAGSRGYYVIDNNWDVLDIADANIAAVLDTLNDGFASQTNQANLDATISSRSILDEEDNIGIDWQDVTNVSAFQIFPNTYMAGLQNPVNVDSARIARSVWNDDIVAQLNRTVDLAACQSGSGAYACSLYVFNAADSSALQGVTLRIMNQSQTATEAVGLSDSEGLIVASLDQAGYIVWPYKSGLSFDPLPDSIEVVAQSLNDTVWASSFDPGQPIEPQLCRVYGWIYDLSGQSLAGVTVSARIHADGLRYGGAAVSPFNRSTVSDSTGFWYLDLLPNQNLGQPVNEYEFVIYYDPGRIVHLRTTVPDLASWELNW